MIAMADLPRRWTFTRPRLPRTIKPTADENARLGFGAHRSIPEGLASLLLENAGPDSYTGAAISSEDCCMAVLVTGAAGFIGYHVCEALLGCGERVVGLDDLNDYYDPSLKRARLDGLAGRNGFSFHKLDIANREAMFAVFDGESGLDRVVHLAAQAGVRHSLEDPYVYVEANVMGQLVVLEACRRRPEFKHLVYASSSSVYGGNEKLPFAVEDRVDRPVSLYAATKRAGELIAQSYADF